MRMGRVYERDAVHWVGHTATFTNLATAVERFQRLQVSYEDAKV